MALITHLQSDAEVKERVELYLYSPSGPSWPVIIFKVYFMSIQNGAQISKIYAVLSLRSEMYHFFHRKNQARVTVFDNS